MTPSRPLRKRLLAVEPTLGCFVGLGSPSVAELLSHVGFDWLVIEAEHTPLAFSELQHILRATSASGTDTLVRVPYARQDFVQLALDAGATGIMVPLVRSAAEASEIVAWTRFPPAGARSFGPLRASQYYAHTRDYFERANDETVVVLIVETREALEQLEAIAAVPGVDALYLGPKDLALSLGLDPFASDSQLEDAERRLVEVTRAAGIAAGNGARSAADIASQLERGFTMIGHGPDYRLLASAAAEGVSAFASARGAPLPSDFRAERPTRL
jgi:4-hydroxy-2-oxoheptanedioate aldolase